MTRLAILANHADKTASPWTFNTLDAPTRADRDALERRARHLKLTFTPATYDELEHILACFFTGYPVLRFYDEDQARDMLRVYIAGLNGKPLWVVDDMLAKLTHEGATPLHPPTHSLMAQTADDIFAAFVHEAAQIDAVLAARTVKREATQEERDRATDHWQNVVKPGLTGLTPAQQKEETERKERQNAQNIRASERLIAIQKKAAGITDDRPIGPELRRFLVTKMEANFGGRTGIGDGEQDDLRGAGRTE